MTKELSLSKCFKADKTNLLECEIAWKETIPDGHRRRGYRPEFPGPRAGLELRLERAEDSSAKGFARGFAC